MYIAGRSLGHTKYTLIAFTYIVIIIIRSSHKYTISEDEDG